VIVVSDQFDTASASSRYCRRFLHLPDLTRDDADTLTRLVDLAQEEGPLPVLFPTSDPDLMLVGRLEAELRRHYRQVAASSTMLTGFTDKRRFNTLAQQHRWPTPRTFVFHPDADVRMWSNSLHYPAIIKPAVPQAWTSRGVLQATGYAKALRLENEDELLRACDQLSLLGAESIVQEYVPGPDEMHYDLHAYVDPERGVLGCFTGRKIRIHPPGAGSGCYVESVYIQEVVDLGLQVLRDVGYCGLANINFKLDARTGEYVLFEVNPRVSAWNILATECGVPLPLLAYARSTGVRCPPTGRQREGVRYINLRNDLKTYMKRRRTESFPVREYVRSLLYRPLVHQTLTFHDPMSGLVAAKRSLVACGRRILGLLRRQVSKALRVPTPETAGTRPLQPDDITADRSTSMSSRHGSDRSSTGSPETASTAHVPTSDSGAEPPEEEGVDWADCRVDQS
jgi:predicted ATP-grasp superfamily ATP-dependent carboligase